MFIILVCVGIGLLIIDFIICVVVIIVWFSECVWLIISFCLLIRVVLLILILRLL